MPSRYTDQEYSDVIKLREKGRTWEEVTEVINSRYTKDWTTKTHRNAFSAESNGFWDDSMRFDKMKESARLNKKKRILQANTRIILDKINDSDEVKGKPSVCIKNVKKGHFPDKKTQKDGIFNKTVDTKLYNSILVVSDLHIPYHHIDSLPFLKALKKRYKFDKVVFIGDEIDYHAISFHDSDPDLPSAGDELIISKQFLKSFYNEFPEASIVESNHGSLVYRKALSSGLSKSFLKSYNEILEAPKTWNWSFDLKLQTKLGMVYFCHGKTGTPGKLASLYSCSCVQGHYHQTSQISYIGTPEKLMFDMHVGCLVDDHSLALGYNKIIPKRPIMSVGVIINGIPNIIPMVLNENGRWNRSF